MLLTLLLLAHWQPQYAELPQATRDWYSTRKLTPAASARFSGQVSCCGAGDVVQTKFHVDRKSGGDQWFYLKAGRWEKIPDDVVHYDENGLEGEAILFLNSSGQPVCFFPADGGI